VIVVADSSKVGTVAFARICEVGRVHELITDGAAKVRPLHAIRDAGIAVEVV
jgi:DeoR family transcriptional regulator of aga operon